MSKMPWLNVPPLSLEEGLRAVELSNYARASTPEAYQYETKQELGLREAATCVWGSDGVWWEWQPTAAEVARLCWRSLW